MTEEEGTMAENAKDSNTKKVRTVNRPWEDVEVTQAQEDELRANGLLVEKGKGDA